MSKFIIGVVFGIIVCTVGFSGIARMVDNGLSKVQSVAKDASR